MDVLGIRVVSIRFFVIFWYFKNRDPLVVAYVDQRIQATYLTSKTVCVPFFHSFSFFAYLFIFFSEVLYVQTVQR